MSDSTSRRRWLTRSLIAVAATVAVSLGMSTGAQAFPGPGDDRMSSTPTSWWAYQNVDAATLGNYINLNGARLTDLRVTSASPLKFTATMVKNTGSYASGWWWYYGQTMSQVNTLLGQNNARLISVVRYGSLYAVVMVSNTGANAKAWWWYDTDYYGVVNTLNANQARLTNISSYTAGRYVVIEVDNTVNGYAWWWWAGLTKAQLIANTNGKTTLDISQNSNGTYNVATISQAGNDGRVFFSSTINTLITYCLTNPQDRPLFVAHINDAGVGKVVTSLRHNY